MQKTKTIITIFLLLTFAASMIISTPTNSSAATYTHIENLPNNRCCSQPRRSWRRSCYQNRHYTSYRRRILWLDRHNGHRNKARWHKLKPLDHSQQTPQAQPFTIYIPNQVGTYKLITNFPQQINPVTFFNTEGGNLIFAGTIMQASTSQPLNLVVQQDPLPAYPGHALPTEYWSRPIDPQLREWYSGSQATG